MRNYRPIYLLGFLICLGLLLFALWLQYHEGEDPCPLCIFQRIAVFILALIFLLATLLNPTALWSRRFYSFSIELTTLVGAGIASRQVWLQHLPPDEIPSCGPGLSFILKTHPFFKSLEVILKGSGECAAVDWRFLTLSIAQWTLIWFILFAVIGLVIGRKKR